MKINKKKLFEAYHYLKEINDTPLSDLDFSEVFESMTEEQRSKIEYIGLLNTDIIFSNIPESLGIERKEEE